MLSWCLSCLNIQPFDLKFLLLILSMHYLLGKKVCENATFVLIYASAFLAKTEQNFSTEMLRWLAWLI